MNAEQFVQVFGNKRDEKKLIRFAKIDPAYATGKPRLVFDGEAQATLKQYPYLASYAPAAGDAVMVVHGVVIGKIMR